QNKRCRPVDLCVVRSLYSASEHRKFRVGHRQSLFYFYSINMQYMNEQEQTDYTRIEAAISYIRNNFKTQPGLDEIAQKMNLSPFHFQRMFTDWAGVSPKKFLQYTSVEYAKS